MEKELILFEKFNLPIKINNLRMVEHGNYRGIHSHIANEIVLVNDGILDCYVNGENISLSKGKIIFINSNIGHRLSSKNANICYMNIDLLSLREGTDVHHSLLYEFILHSKSKPFLVFDSNKEISDILLKIKDRYFENQENSRWYLKAYLYELLAFMYSQAFIVPTTLSPKQIQKIGPAVGYIETNYKSAITLEKICASVKYNKYALCHMFKTITGSTLFDYINFVRVHYAVEKLKETGNSILEIATECGFSSATYFCRVFKSFFGCSPSVYRKILTENFIG